MAMRPSRTFIAAALAASVLVAFGQDTAPPDPKVTVVTGTLVKEDGSPWPGLTVRAYAESGSEAQIQTLSDDQGAFTVRVRADSFDLGAREEGNAPDDRPPTTILVVSGGFGTRIRSPRGARIDLGTCVARRAGLTLVLRTVCDGTPVPGVPLFDSRDPLALRKTESEIEWRTDSEGKARIWLPLVKGERFSIFADDDLRYFGTGSGECPNAGSTLEVDIPLSVGRGKLICRLRCAGCGRDPVIQRTTYFVGWESSCDRRTFPERILEFYGSRYSRESKFSEEEFSALPPGRWHASAMCDGVPCYPEGGAGAWTDLPPWEKRMVTLVKPGPCNHVRSEVAGQPPPEQHPTVGDVEGDVNYSIGRWTLLERTKIRRKWNVRKPLLAGVYFLPRRSDGTFVLQPMVPNAVIDLDRTSHYHVRGLPAGEYLAFATGVSPSVSHEEPWEMSDTLYAKMLKGVVRVEPGGVSRIDFSGAIEASEYARQHDVPLHVAERYFEFLALFEEKGAYPYHEEPRQDSK